MSKSAHRTMLQEMEDGIIESMEDYKNGEDFPSIKDISTNRSYTEFTMVVDREAFENSLDGFAALGLGFSSLYYQLFSGADPDTFQTTINFEDEETGEIFDTVVYPDALN